MSDEERPGGSGAPLDRLIRIGVLMSMAFAGTSVGHGQMTNVSQRPAERLMEGQAVIQCGRPTLTMPSVCSTSRERESEAVSITFSRGGNALEASVWPAWLIGLGAVVVALLGRLLYSLKMTLADVLRRAEPLAGARALEETERETLQGRVVGFEPGDGGYTWLGIPYAQAERWRAPRRAAPWKGLRPALVPGHRSPQFNPTDRVFGGAKEEWGKVEDTED